MYAAHPKKSNLVLVPGALLAAANCGDYSLEEIESRHSVWVKTDDWTKSRGRFAPKLDIWLTDRGFTQLPDGFRSPPSSAPAKVIPYDPQKAAVDLAKQKSDWEKEASEIFSGFGKRKGVA